MRAALVGMLGLLALPALLVAHDARQPRAPGMHRIRTLLHSGDSPFTPIDEDDTVFVVDSDTGLDTDCAFHTDGPLQIHLYIARYVGPIRSDHTLQSPTDLVNRRLLSQSAHLRMPVYDVDVRGDPDDASVPPEVDHVFINGHSLGTLTGDNNIWKLNEFRVPIEWLKFPAAGKDPGDFPDFVDNVITINIDDASGGKNNWCTAADWVELDFSAIAPIFLVHGTSSDSSTWEPAFTSFFKDSGAPWSNAINLPPNGSILGNGRKLAARVQELANQFGARKCHIIAHSKGGLDTRAYLDQYYVPDYVRILSVYTLSTPHHGTILADIAAAARASPHPESPNPDLQTIIDIDSWGWLTFARFVSNVIPKGDALRDQTTTAMATFNDAHPSIPAGILFYNYGADADLNHDSSIEKDEVTDAADLSAIGTLLHRVIGTTASIRVTSNKRPARWGEKTYTTIDIANSNSAFVANDLVVSVDSARGPGGLYLGTQAANHSTIKSSALASTLLEHILADFPNR